MENQIGKKIKVLRLDNGGEYTSRAFDEYCRQEGVKRQLIVPRKNRSIVGASRAMLHDQSLPFFL